MSVRQTSRQTSRHIPALIHALFVCAGLAACGGGGSDVTVQVPTTPAPAPGSAPTPAPAPAPAPGAAWPVAAYEFWISNDDPNALGTATVAPDRSLVLSNIAVRFTAPFTSGCAISNGSCVERLSARAAVVCPQGQPDVALVDARAVKVTDLTALNGTAYHAVFGCDDATTATATVSATGEMTVDADALYPLGPLAPIVASGRFTVRRIDTAAGARHVIVERRTDGFIALFVQD